MRLFMFHVKLRQYSHRSHDTTKGVIIGISIANSLLVAQGDQALQCFK
jgi:hypothetical protein